MLKPIKVFNRFLNYRTRNKVMSVVIYFAAPRIRYCLTNSECGIYNYKRLIY